MIGFDGHLDLLVVGGGIVGAGIARDAAMRKLRIGLVEQQDFAAGTSSRSTRLLHGGIRYLAQGRIGLVREASREKTILHQIAPHLSNPLAFVYPAYRKRGLSLWKLRLGVKLYDLLCGRRNLGPSRHLNPRETTTLLPQLAIEGLTGSVRYFDGLTSDARLVLDTLRSATHHGAAIHNYVQFLKATPEPEGWICHLQDVQSGNAFQVRTRCLANATGPWSDQIDHSQTSLRLTKGVHLVIDQARLPISEAVVLTEGERLLFAIPWGERVILGTTDTDYDKSNDGPIERPRCLPEDSAHVLESANRVFPESRLSTADVISNWAGLRPLVADRRGNPSDISRRHEICMNHPGWWDVTGGKLTTYRLMAEDTVNAMVGYLELDDHSCRTAEEPLLTRGEVEGVSTIVPPEVSPEAVAHYCRTEWAKHLDDVMIRRTSWRYYHRDHWEIAHRVADWMARELGWGEKVVDEEVARYQQLARGHVRTVSSRSRLPDGT